MPTMCQPFYQYFDTFCHQNKSAGIFIHYSHFTFKETKLRDTAEVNTAVVELRPEYNPVYILFMHLTEDQIYECRWLLLKHPSGVF